MTQTITPVDLSTLDAQEIDAIKKEAMRRGVTFDDACKQMLVEHSRQLQKRARLSPLARLMGFRVASQK